MIDPKNQISIELNEEIAQGTYSNRLNLLLILSVLCPEYLRRRSNRGLS